MGREGVNVPRTLSQRSTTDPEVIPRIWWLRERSGRLCFSGFDVGRRARQYHIEVVSSEGQTQTVLSV